MTYFIIGLLCFGSGLYLGNAIGEEEDEPADMDRNMPCGDIRRYDYLRRFRDDFGGY